MNWGFIIDHYKIKIYNPKKQVTGLFKLSLTEGVLLELVSQFPTTQKNFQLLNDVVKPAITGIFLCRKQTRNMKGL